MITRICGIGAGYVGGPTLTMVAKYCPELEVTIVDLSEKLIQQWNSDELPIYESGLDQVIKEVRGRNLFFSTDIDKAIDEAEVIFISVDTPTKKYGNGQGRAPNLTSLEAAARHVVKVSRSPKIVVEKSTVPIKAADTIKKILRCSNFKNKGDFKGITAQLEESVVLSNPEFLTEGTAIENLRNPDRVLIGGDMKSPSGQIGIDVLRWIYSHWVDDERILLMSTWSSELSKLVANAFLAQRISSINAVSAICEQTGADIREVARAVGTDSRIGKQFLKASLGFGGSCFKKDILNLVYISECLKLPEVASYWYSVLSLNDYQLSRFCTRIVSKFNNTLGGKRMAVFGFAFKANTHDTRESQAIEVCNALLGERATVTVYDPKVPAEMVYRDLCVANDPALVHESVKVCSSPLEAATDAFAVIICTEWEEFKKLNYRDIFKVMKYSPVIFDGRVLLDHEELIEIGFDVESIGVRMDDSNGGCSGIF